jgi:hypothetical protein
MYIVYIITSEIWVRISERGSIMSKRLGVLGLILSLTILLFANVPVNAASQSEKDKMNTLFDKAAKQNHYKSDKYAYIGNDSGPKYKVKMFNIDEQTASDEFTQTYVFSTEEQYVEPVKPVDSTLSLGYSQETTAWNNIFNINNINTVVKKLSTQNNNDWDESISVYGTLTITYTRTGAYYLITNVAGGWTISDSSVSLSNRIVNYACYDPTTYDTQNKEKKPTSNSFSYATGFTKSAESTSEGVVIAANSRVTLTHGSSVWQLQIPNTIVDNGWSPSF